MHDKDTCKDDITKPERLTALQQFKNNKSPGCDGLSKEFHLRFWPQLGKKLVKVHNHSIHNGHLTISQRRGILPFFRKK